MFANNFLPTGFGGDAARALVIARAAPSTARAVASVVVDRFTALACLVSCVAGTRRSHPTTCPARWSPARDRDRRWRRPRGAPRPSWSRCESWGADAGARLTAAESTSRRRLGRRSAAAQKRGRFWRARPSSACFTRRRWSWPVDPRALDRPRPVVLRSWRWSRHSSLVVDSVSDLDRRLRSSRRRLRRPARRGRGLGARRDALLAAQRRGAGDCDSARRRCTAASVRHAVHARPPAGRALHSRYAPP